MFCETYRDALTEASACRSELRPEIAAHLARCAGCREAFGRERLLYEAIDGGLRKVANVDVPSSLVPFVRDAISAGINGGFRLSWAGVLASSALVACSFSLWWHTHTPPQQISGAPTAANVPRASGSGEPARQPRTAPVLRNLRQTAVHSQYGQDREMQASVPAGTQIAIAQFVRLASKQPEIAESLIDNSEERPIAIAPIQVAELTWQPVVVNSEGENHF